MQASFTQHPVTRAELKYQWHVIETSRSSPFWVWAAYILLVPALLISVVSFFFTLIVTIRTPDALNFPYIPQPALYLGGLYLLGINTAMALVVTLVTLALAANSIAREKRRGTWDMLLLTNVSARQLVWGKWWATLGAMGWDHGVLYLLRLGLLALAYVVLAYIMLGFQPFPGLGRVPPLLPFVLAPVLLAACTALDAGLTAALGVLIALLPLEGAAAFLLGLGLRLLLSMILVPLCLGLLAVMQGNSSAGLLLLALLLAALWAGLTWGALRLAQLFAVRQQVSR